MFDEGRGTVAPKPVVIPVDRHVQVVLQREAEKRAARRRYSGRSDSWGKGLINANGSVSRAVAPILVGCVGEWAFAEYVNSRLRRRICETDLSLHEGDGGKDFVIASVVHQLKTRQKKPGPSYVRRVNERRHLCTHTASRFVFTQWRIGQAECLMLGWIPYDDLLSCKLGKSPVAQHWNSIVPDNMLRPMDRLLCEIRSDMSMEAMAWH